MLNEPLSYKVRPKSLDEVLGQKHLIGENKILTNMVSRNMLFSMILYGKPGTGKTTIALAISATLKVKCKLLNAITCSKKDIESAIFEASFEDNSYVLIIDEVHRLNKNIQDVLLPSIESGKIILIGATTANPYHSINSALRSRCQILEIKPLEINDVKVAISRAISHKDGLNSKYSITDEAIDALATYSGGDVRFALNKLEIATLLCNDYNIDLEIIKKVLNKSNIKIDKNEDGHYDSVSALQKAIRGSDVDAALYYLARLIAADDLDSIERRLSVTAYEDIGLANPAAVDRVMNALNCARMVGFPEAAIPLGFAVCDLALSPKSKSACEAIHKAIDLVNEAEFDIPDYLKLTPMGENKYDYSRLDCVEKIQYLPTMIKNMKFYIPNKNSGPYEQSLIKNYERLEKIVKTANLNELYKK